MPTLQRFRAGQVIHVPVHPRPAIEPTLLLSAGCFRGDPNFSDWFGYPRIMADRRGTGIASDMPGTPWQREGFIATPCRVGGGLRKRRSMPALELMAGSVRTEFLCREISQFFDGKIDNIEESSADGGLVYLYRVAEGVAYPGMREDLPVGSIALLSAEPAMHPVVVLAADAAADFGRWYRALPSW